MSTEIELSFPYREPVKKMKKEQMIADIVSSFQSVGDSSVKVLDSYYVDRHAKAQAVAWVVKILTTLGNVATIAMAIREFLKRNPEFTELRITKDSVNIAVSRNMSDEERRQTRINQECRHQKYSQPERC